MCTILDIYYIKQGIIVSVGALRKPSQPKLAIVCAKSKETVKSIMSYCIHSYSISIGDNDTHFAQKNVLTFIIDNCCHLVFRLHMIVVAISSLRQR